MSTVSHFERLGFAIQKSVFAFTISGILARHEVFHSSAVAHFDLSKRYRYLISESDQVGARDVQLVGCLHLDQMGSLGSDRHAAACDCELRDKDEKVDCA